MCSQIIMLHITDVQLNKRRDKFDINTMEHN